MNNHLTTLSLILLLNVLSISAKQQVYVVYLGEHSGEKTFDEIEHLHHSYLQSVKGSKEKAKASIVHSYKNVINGFSALLTPQESQTISEMEGVISVFPSSNTVSPHTTRSWDFVSLLEAEGDTIKAKRDRDEILRKADSGKNVIVGVIDTGVWPESMSFNDDGMEPVPSSWKGRCQTGEDFNSSNCNRKLIGARYYLEGFEADNGKIVPDWDFRSPRDSNGHGTHTASTVGGRRVPNAATTGGFGNGTATGGAPLVRLAVYKVCWYVPVFGNVSCTYTDILAAFDNAIADGVHVISVSLGGTSSSNYSDDANAIGALHAMRRNIVVACSAGNSGPTPSTVTNVAPWIITVGASSIDRVFSSPVRLGNGVELQGQTITPFREATYPLVNVGDGLCRNLTASHVSGKAVFCREINGSYEVRRVGGAAAVLKNLYDGIGIDVTNFGFPATVVFANETSRIENYIRSNRAPTATFHPVRTLIGAAQAGPAPFMAPFTSRGPNGFEPNILKPDITAPGLNILAAYTNGEYQIISGTSMACPHVAAVAALLKAIHPTWSSAAIRSALITTARSSNNMGNPIRTAVGNPAKPFDLGAGHIQPLKAVDPGLVYDASYNDYLLSICRSNGNSLDRNFTCPSQPPSPSELNYPSLAIAGLRGSVTVNRTVTNVGTGSATYLVTYRQPTGFSVRIVPAVLRFGAAGEKQSFNVTVRAESGATRNMFAFGSYTWSDGIHQVTSPIAVSTI